MKIIPKPATLHINDSNSHITLTNDSLIILECTQENLPMLKDLSNYFIQTLKSDCNISLSYSEKIPENHNATNVKLVLRNSHQSAESYQLQSSKNLITISANSYAGLFYGIQTLRQLVSRERKIPILQITDEPRFKWRGFMLDCGRHFWSTKFIKKYIDLLAYYKMNVFHWHLTEDQGWRLEIKKYPKLTSVSAWRKDPSTGKKYGGFYSQDEVREIVAYAAQRNILVVPEIEFPGHCVAALAAYPELSCTGKSLNVETRWGIHKDVYCAGNEKVFTFIEDVLSEVIDLFPGPYIHIGGDECPKDRWKECKKCQARIQSEKLKDENELQSYCIKRISSFLESKKKKLIGWDEIIQGGLPKNATVQSWKSMKGAIIAAKSGNDTIVSPMSHAYFDYGVEWTSLRKVLSFNPIPPELKPEQHKFVIGGECNCWTERMKTEQDVDSMVFPRLTAMSEVLWSKHLKKDYDEFLTRWNIHKKTLENFGVKYGCAEKSFWNMIHLPCNIAMEVIQGQFVIPWSALKFW